jgi:hypothetical protein
LNRNILYKPKGVVPKDGAGAPPKSDDYLARLLKYIPAEVIGVYLVVLGLVRQGYSDDAKTLQILLWGLAIFGVVATALVALLKLAIKNPGQIAMMCIAFVVWVAGTDGVFATLAFWKPIMGSIAVVLFGFCAYLFNFAPAEPKP